MPRNFNTYSISEARDYIRIAGLISERIGQRPCYDEPRLCAEAYDSFYEAYRYLSTVWTNTILGRDANGYCLNRDPGLALDTAEWLMEASDAFERRHGGRFDFHDSYYTIRSRYDDPHCVHTVSPAPAPRPSPTYVPYRPAPVLPGPERCGDPNIPADATLTSYWKYGGAGQTHEMKGEYACPGSGKYMRVTHSELTTYQCRDDFETDCRQVRVELVTDYEADAKKTTYTTSRDSWWTKRLK